jgi:glycosyltransferase involved in cell wall biosynthesis
LPPNFPLVSVCIPACNAEKYIGITINSLLQQTYTNIEIIVVDDGSTDNTKRILENFKDKRFTYFTGPNKGAAAARNKAFLLSAGAYIKFMDADDLINTICIEEQLLKIIDQPDCIASAKWGRFYEADFSDFKLSPEKVWKNLPGIDWIVDSLINSGGNMMQPGIFLLPRNIIEKAGPWNEGLSLIDDFDYMIRVISHSSCVLFCEEAILMYRSGVFNNLSGKKNSEHMQSAFESLNLGVKRILKVKNDNRSRLACANTYQRWAYQFYPSHQELLQETEKKIKNLGGSNLQIIGSKKYVLLSRLIGWKRARRLRLLFTGNE